jgi:SAM-dependent methyltransferase
LARTGGPVLELASGTGRVTVPLGAIGLDLSVPMLRAAARRGAVVLAGDMRSFALHARFPLILVPWNSLQLLDAAGRAACLSCVSDHLAEGGLLGLELIDLEPLEVPLGPVYGDELARLEGELSWRAGAMVYRRRYTASGGTVEDTITLHDVTDDELDAAGFEVVEREDDGPRRRLALRYAGAPR